MYLDYVEAAIQRCVDNHTITTTIYYWLDGRVAWQELFLQVNNFARILPTSCGL